jgi:hypothetical protein
MKSTGGLNIHKINSSRDSFSPELRNKGGKQQSSSGLKKVTMLTLSNTILSVSTGARVLRKSVLLKKKVTKRTRWVLSGRVGTKNTNGSHIVCEPS